MGYITNFIVYTLAMVGVIVVALLVFKNATSIGQGRSSKYMKLIDTMSLGSRKTLYIVSAGKEKFLIAGDVDKTSLIAKLDDKTELISEESSIHHTTSSPDKELYENFTANIGIRSSILSGKRDISDILKK